MLSGFVETIRVDVERMGMSARSREEEKSLFN
jgi:hypothetical protein